MHIKNVKSIVAILGLAVSVASCQKKPDPVTPPEPATNSEVHINFKNYVGANPLALNTQTYKNSSGEDFTVSMFKYYISNIKLKKSDGTEFAEPESYHLINAEVLSSGHLHVKEVPAGEYAAISFMIGVDSVRNVSGAQTGALDPANTMFWTWNTGYIMAKLEGTSPSSTAGGQKFVHHVGGFSGQYNALRTVTLNFQTPIKLTGKTTAGDVIINTDVQKWFSTPNVISIASVPTIMNAGPTSKKIADNYTNMFILQGAAVAIE